MKHFSSSKFGTVMAMGAALESAAMALSQVAYRHLRPRAPRSRGSTVRPGGATPRWLALVAAVRPHLRRRGEKSLLARQLGLHPARMHEFFIARSAMPDAERTLLLLGWLRRKQDKLI